MGRFLMALMVVVGTQVVADNYSPSRYNVVWDAPSVDSSGSMPLGNGDIALNVWTEPSGDLLFYIAKTDAWDAYGDFVKVGKVRVSFDPPLSKESFRQELSLVGGSIRISGGKDGQATKVKVWADANRPVVWVEMESAAPTTARVAVEPWRQEQRLRRFLKDRVILYQMGGQPRGTVPKGAPDPISNRCFGMLLKGEGFDADGSLALAAKTPASKRFFSVSLLAKQTADEKQFIADLEAVAAREAAGVPGDAWGAHAKWWAAFWDRSWIDVTSGSDAANAATVSQGYALQRFKNACAGRGASPIKFNGSLFTMDLVLSEREYDRRVNADFRNWGCCYWLQNTRLMYWPMLACGDFEMMRPLFKMYADLTPYLEARSKEANKHAGAEFFETISIFGMDQTSPHTRRDWNGALELLAMLLDYHAYTGDEEALKGYLLPMAKSYLDFFDLHFKRENGKLNLTPSHANETYWEIVNPTPDVAGLHWVIDGLLRLPEKTMNSEFRAQCLRMRGELPPIPVTDADWAKPFRSPDGKTFPFPREATPGAACVAPAMTILDKAPNNCENPELYAVFPFRVYGVGKPDLAVGRETFIRRLYKGSHCWRQDDIQAACLGLAKEAKECVAARARKAERCRFPAFWGPGSDYVPDEDHGGVLMEALQLMLLQADGGKLVLFPAWPKEWDVNFKLRAPEGRMVKATLKNGKLEARDIAPPLTEEKVVVCVPQ